MCKLSNLVSIIYCRIIAKGARGGKGADALGESRSAMVRMVKEFSKGQEIYFLIGQEGQDACRKLVIRCLFSTPTWNFSSACFKNR